ncbi:MAG: IS66 family transposase [Thiolinea sp.]
MNQNSSNSSRPPGSEAPWAAPASETDGDSGEVDEVGETPFKGSGSGLSGSDKADAAGSESDTDGQPSSPSQKRITHPPGRQPGSQGFGRTQRLTVTDTQEYVCGHCFGCGYALDTEGQTAYTGFYTVDLIFGDTGSPGLKLTHTLHRYYRCVCPSCGLDNRHEPTRQPPDTSGDWGGVGLTEWRLIGPGLAALIAYLCMDMRVSRRKVGTLLYDLFGLKLCVGSLQASLIESARALSPVEDALVNELLEHELLHADETSHKEAGALLWLWVFVTTTTALFLVGSRGKEIWRNLLDSCETVFEGWLMTDGYQAYRDYARRLRCWAHLLRKAKGLQDNSYDWTIRHYGRQLKDHLDTLMRAVYQAREGPDNGRVSIAAGHQDTLNQIRLLCEAMKASAHKKTHELGVEFLNDWEAIFRILDYPAWPLTNNEAERALRHWVILRKMSQGTRCEQGSRALALFASVITTCRLRKASPLWFMRDVIQARRAGKDVPELPAIPVG